VTERKPPGVSFISWIDKQIQEATERGAFDDLPGSGKPLPRRADSDDGQAWIRDKLRREGESTDLLLPPSLRLRKERAQLAEAVHAMDSEREVRDAVGELNRRIAEWRRIPVGPNVFVPLLDAEEMVSRWQASRPARKPLRPAASAGLTASSAQRRRTRWWRGPGRA